MTIWSKRLDNTMRIHFNACEWILCKGKGKCTTYILLIKIPHPKYNPLTSGYDCCLIFFISEAPHWQLLHASRYWCSRAIRRVYIELLRCTFEWHPARLDDVVYYWWIFGTRIVTLCQLSQRLWAYEAGQWYFKEILYTFANGIHRKNTLKIDRAVRIDRVTELLLNSFSFIEILPMELHI